ncbi:hypothetical protein HY639_02330 [Candidatus Woesearchaeota archaeon]|nr:hypothetical protein [Candidatus Woesearchaeota archaeon]
MTLDDRLWKDVCSSCREVSSSDWYTYYDTRLGGSFSDRREPDTLKVGYHLGHCDMKCPCRQRIAEEEYWKKDRR